MGVIKRLRYKILKILLLREIRHIRLLQESAMTELDYDSIGFEIYPYDYNGQDYEKLMQVKGSIHEVLTHIFEMEKI